MAVEFEVPVYGLTGAGNKIYIGKSYHTRSSALITGGKIFYIDSSATGATYTFYDSEGNVMTDVQVGDTPYAYSITGTPSKDKYYIFNNQLFTSKRWTYYKDGAYVYNSLGTGVSIGQGKTNTTTVMAADNGAYVTSDSNGYPTIWYQLKLVNDANTGGRNDWFVPSRNEGEALRTATDSDGNALVTWFRNNSISSSSESSAQNFYGWSYLSGGWSAAHQKYLTVGLFAVRSF